MKLQKKDSLIWLVWVTLFISFIIKLIFYLQNKATYSFDELILTTISQQPLSLLFDTILSDPHPPGIYLFLKLFPVKNIAATKILITCLSYTLFSVAILIATAKGYIKKFSLSLGLIAFFSSFTFWLITSEVKQDAITFPLVLVGIVFLISLFKERKTKIIDLIGITTTLSVVCCFGYINYGLLLGLFSLWPLSFMIRKKPLPKSSLIIITTQIMLVTIYFLGLKTNWCGT